SKCGWTPYAGLKVRGRVQKVVIRGEEAYVDGEVHVRPGFGKNMRILQATSLVRAGSTNELDLDTSMRELHVEVEQAKDEHGRSISSEGTPSPVIIPATPREFTLVGSHLLSVHDLTKTMINRIFDVADRFRCDVERRHSLTHILDGYVMCSMFYEVSTRTASSFSAAMQRLGGSVVHMDSHSSSVQKGETLEDSVTIMSNYADIVVLRHNETGAAARAAAVSSRPVVNAGDGSGEHPSQALLDVYTIRQELGTLNGVTIAMVGDLKNGRTVHSLAKLLCVYKDITLHYVSPVPELGMPEYVVDYVNKKAGFTQKVFRSLSEGIQDVDVIYVTRIQKERFTSAEEYNRVKGSYVLTAKLLNAAARPQDFGGNILGPSRNLPIVLHPLPRVDEISTELDHDDRAAYFRQAKNGMYVRMAILAMILGKAPL
ncbi:aspartate carbamoyltransferase, partial [Oesophagostomum dentatum]